MDDHEARRFRAAGNSGRRWMRSRPAVAPSDLTHTARRPEWTCDGCPPDNPWPCAVARVELGERHAVGPVTLAVHMQGLLEQAARELPRVSPAVLFERFIAWTGRIG